MPLCDPYCVSYACTRVFGHLLEHGEPTCVHLPRETRLFPPAAASGSSVRGGAHVSFPIRCGISHTKSKELAQC